MKTGKSKACVIFVSLTDFTVSKNWCFWAVMLEKTLETPLDSKEIKPVNPRGNQSWIFIRRTDAPILRSPDVESWPSEKTLMLGKTKGRRKRGWQRDKMASLTQWTWVWASSKRWWRTGKPGMLQSMGSQRVGHDWKTEQQWQNTSPPREAREIKGACIKRGKYFLNLGKIELKGGEFQEGGSTFNPWKDVMQDQDEKKIFRFSHEEIMDDLCRGFQSTEGGSQTSVSGKRWGKVSIDCSFKKFVCGGTKIEEDAESRKVWCFVLFSLVEVEAFLGKSKKREGLK